MMRKLVSAMVLALAACAPAQEDVVQESAAREANVSQGLPAPTPQDVVLRIGAEQEGRTVQLRVGERFAVELVGVPTAGYVWAPAVVPAFLTRAGEASGPTSPAQNQPGFTGGNHWEVMMFAATGPGTGELKLEQRRPWESNEPPNAVYSVNVIVAP